MTGSGRVDVIAMAQPTVNGRLHVGHLSGPFVAADIAARAARARGAQVLVMNGLDVHQNYVLTRAEIDGIGVDDMIDRYRADIVRAFEGARVGYDAFVDPRQRDYRQAIAGLASDLVASGALPMREVGLLACADCGRTLHHSYVSGTCAACGAAVSGGSCEGCGGFTSAQTMLDPVCARCGGAPRPFRAAVPVLVLEDHRAALEALWVRAQLPDMVRAVIARNLAVGLPDIPLAYPTNWGVEGTGQLAGLRFDVYAELPLNLLRGVARALEPAAPAQLTAYVDVWRRRVGGLWPFYGIDNAYYFGIICPAMLAVAGVDIAGLAGLGVVNHFYRLDGQKISTSRDHAIWANDLLADEDPAIVRLYLAWDRPDRFASDFTRESFAAFAEYVRPLLAGKAGGAPGLPGPLLAIERERGERALDLIGFDPPLAVRSLLALLAAGAETGYLGSALTGEPEKDAEDGGG